MTPKLRQLYDENPDLHANLLDWQYYDLTRVMQLVMTMAEDAGGDYPVFLNADIPAPKTCFIIGDHGISVVADGDLRFADVIESFAACNMNNYVIRTVERDMAEIKRMGRYGTASADDVISWYESSVKAIEKCARYRGKHTARTGDSTGSPLLVIASVCCDLIADQTLFRRVDAVAPRAFRRRLERDGRAAPSHYMVDFARSYTEGLRARSDPMHHKALHFCSGHWRRCDGPRSRVIDGVRKTWVSGHWRGSPEFGIVTKTYVAGRKFLAARAAMVGLAPEREDA